MPEPYQKVVVITGSLGSGKSTAAALLKEEGAEVVSADELAREAVRPGSSILQKIAAIFGTEMILPNLELDRKRMGKLVFSDPEKRKQLEKLVHPEVQRLAEERFQAALDRGIKSIIYDCPLYFESGLDNLGFAASILIAAPKDLCLERVMKRDDLTRAEAEARLSAQFSVEEKSKRASVVVWNDSSIEELKTRLRLALNQISIS